jgi:hypothetical protein
MVKPDHSKLNLFAIDSGQSIYSEEHKDISITSERNAKN